MKPTIITRTTAVNGFASSFTTTTRFSATPSLSDVSLTGLSLFSRYRIRKVTYKFYLQTVTEPTGSDITNLTMAAAHVVSVSALPAVPLIQDMSLFPGWQMKTVTSDDPTFFFSYKPLVYQNISPLTQSAVCISDWLKLDFDGVRVTHSPMYLVIDSPAASSFRVQYFSEIEFEVV